MNVTVSVARLKELDACKEAVAAFREHFGESASADWTPEKQLDVLRSPLGKYLGWAWGKNLLPMWRMGGAYLGGADLGGADLGGADLRGAKICLCRNGPCVRLCQVLDAAGWVANAAGLLETNPAASEVEAKP